VRGPVLKSNVRKKISFSSFAKLDLFFEYEAAVSPCFSPPLVLKCFQIKKKQKVKGKDLIALVLSYPIAIPNLIQTHPLSL
jgi:hypothetical protein